MSDWVDAFHDTKFCKWAFGKELTFQERALELMDAWNKIHGEVLMLSEDGSIAEDVERMYELYKQS